MTLGIHTLIEYHDCSLSALTDGETVRALMLEAVRLAGGTYVTDVFHHFSPHGISGVVVIAESHATIHTWPEHGYAAVDVFTCAASFNHDVFTEHVRDGLQSARVEKKTLTRGASFESQSS